MKFKHHHNLISPSLDQKRSALESGVMETEVPFTDSSKEGRALKNPKKEKILGTV